MLPLLHRRYNMGMYTELVLGIELDHDRATIQKLNYMLNETKSNDMYV